MVKRLKKYFIGFAVLMMLSVSAVSAQTYVTCQNKVQTGHGYYNANCSGNYIRMTCYYSDSSEKYFVSNYIGISGSDYAYSAGVYAGKKNNTYSKNVGKSYNSYYHIHHFTVSLI